ncbi:hypothetical protein [Telluribacter humicola]
MIKGLVLLFLTFSCERASTEEATTKAAYLGSWERVEKAEKGFTIYEQDRGVFLKYRNGETHPLQYEASGNYYYAVTPLGNRPLLLKDGKITIQNGFTFTYTKTRK